METRDVPPDVWPDLDGAAEPSVLVHYLNVVGAMVEAQGYKRHTFDALEVIPGHRILDVGCGAGGDVRRLAGLVGSAGRAVGVDSSDFMIAEAERRALGSGLPTEFHVASVYELPFQDSISDGCGRTDCSSIYRGGI